MPVFDQLLALNKDCAENMFSKNSISGWMQVQSIRTRVLIFI